MFLVYVFTQRFHRWCYKQRVLLPWIISSFSIIFKAEKVSIWEKFNLWGFSSLSDLDLWSLVTDKKIWFLDLWHEEQNILDYLK